MTVGCKAEGFLRQKEDVERPDELKGRSGASLDLISRRYSGG